MADLSVTAANCLKSTSSLLESGYAGETITAGQAVYKSSTTGLYMKADSNSATVEARKAHGIAMNGASLSQPLVVQSRGDITLGATLTAGVAYYLSATPGGVCPLADVGSGDYVCLLGLAKSTTVLTLDIQFPNVSN